MKKKTIWQPWQSTSSKELFRNTFMRKHKPRYLMATETEIIIYKDPEFTIPKKRLLLDFGTKFEVLRTAPKMKGNCSPVKLSSNARQDQVKSENIAELGSILSISFMLEDELEFKYEITAEPDILLKWRWFLGTKINQIGFHHLFKVYKKIGKGNFASVYLAERVEDGQQMAIKAFSKSVAYAEENGRAGLINEINIMRQLNNPNIIRLYECHETQNSLYMGLELLEGGQLYEQLKKKVIFQNKEIQVIMKGLIQGIRHVHSKDIMHRDIKLENILFKKANQIDSVCIADFGLATNVNDPVYLYCRCGTPGFVAPEVINIKDLNTRYDKVCDIYSLGLVFYLLITGKPAFSGRSYTTIVNQNKEAKINWKASIFEIIPKSAVDLLREMLNPDPRFRITAEQVLSHSYFTSVDFDEEEPIGDDSSPLVSRLNQINEMYERIISRNNKFDMLRINQLTNSPLKSPNIRAAGTNEMKQSIIQCREEGLTYMHTPVLTGRIDDIDESPGKGDIVKSLQLEKKHRRQESSTVLQKYSQKQQEEVQQKPHTEECNFNLQQIKQSLSKNL